MSKISIIGANSYIARNVIIKCKEYGLDDVMLYDIQPTHVDASVNYKQLDILSKESLEKVDFDCDILFVFTGKTGTVNGFDDYNSYIDINEKGLLNILDTYRNKKSKAKIIFPSTRLIYKGKKDIKLKEEDEKEFNTIYAINKYSCEQYLKMYHHMYNVQYCIFRICVPYGTIIPNASSYGTAEFFLSKAKKNENITLYGDGLVKRTLIYMGDLCDAFIKGALRQECLNDVYNIGGSDDSSLYDMASLIAEIYNVQVEFVKWPEAALKVETGDTIFNSDKFDTILGFDYKKSFPNWIKEQ